MNHRTIRLSAPGSAVRVAGTLLVGALLLAGTGWGGDDWFPVGPFRKIVGVRVVQRWYEIRGGEPSGRYRETTPARWGAA